jgi:hypothetical protein
VGVKMEMTTSFATRAVPGQAASEPTPGQMPQDQTRRPALDGDISVRIRLELTEGGEGVAPRAHECATLAGAQGTWLVVMAGGGGAGSRTLLFFVRAEAVK